MHKQFWKQRPELPTCQERAGPSSWAIELSFILWVLLVPFRLSWLPIGLVFRVTILTFSGSNLSLTCLTIKLPTGRFQSGENFLCNTCLALRMETDCPKPNSIKWDSNEFIWTCFFCCPLICLMAWLLLVLAAVYSITSCSDQLLFHCLHSVQLPSRGSKIMAKKMLYPQYSSWVKSITFHASWRCTIACHVFPKLSQVSCNSFLSLFSSLLIYNNICAELVAFPFVSVCSLTHSMILC